ncbi:hypothetical protein GQ457_17G011700 [Hibiscus cannabinus]
MVLDRPTPIFSTPPRSRRFKEDPGRSTKNKSFRKISELDKIKIKSMHNSGIAPNRMMWHFVNEVGSIENVGFILKDMYNFLDRIKRE